MVGRKLAEFGLPAELPVSHSFVKSPVFPFQKFPGVDTILGPEMKSTGEVMGVADSFGLAFAKAQLGARQRIPVKGRVFISVNDHDKPAVIPIARDLESLGFTLIATRGTAAALRAAGIKVEKVFKVNEGRPNVVDRIKSADIDLIINTPLGRKSRFDDKAIRRAAVQHGVTCITTLSAADAAIQGIRALQGGSDARGRACRNSTKLLQSRGLGSSDHEAKSKSSRISKALFCPVVTPFNRRGDVDEGFFRENLSRLAGIGLSGILVAGSTGEAPYLPRASVCAWSRLAREIVKPPEILLVGTGLESTGCHAAAQPRSGGARS